MGKNEDRAVPGVDAIREWMVSKIVGVLSIHPGEIDTKKPFAQYGLDSLVGITLAAELESWLKVKLPETLLWDYPTIDLLANHLSDLLQAENQGK